MKKYIISIYFDLIYLIDFQNLKNKKKLEAVSPVRRSLSERLKNSKDALTESEQSARRPLEFFIIFQILKIN